MYKSKVRVIASTASDLHANMKYRQRHSSEDSLEGEQGKAALLENDVELWCCLLLTYLLVEQDWRQVLNSPDAAAAPESCMLSSYLEQRNLLKSCSQQQYRPTPIPLLYDS